MCCPHQEAQKGCISHIAHDDSELAPFSLSDRDSMPLALEDAAADAEAAPPPPVVSGAAGAAA